MTGFEYDDSRETYESLEKWLKERRDQYIGATNPGYFNAVNELLDEVRDAGVEGFLPWQRQ